MNHIDPKRLPCVTSFSCVSTAALDSPATWSVIASVRGASAVACHVSGTGHRGHLLATSPYCLQETISKAISAQADKYPVSPAER